MRVFARHERPHPGAQLTLFEAGDGWRNSLWGTNRPATTRGWLGQNACLDAAHRVHARVEDAIRTGKDCGIGKYEVAKVLIKLGAVQLRLGELEAARVSLERALVISEAVYGPDHPELVPALINLGAVQLELGEQDAGVSIERALAMSEAVYGSDHPEVAKALINLGVVQWSWESRMPAPACLNKTDDCI